MLFGRCVSETVTISVNLGQDFTERSVLSGPNESCSALIRMGNYATGRYNRPLSDADCTETTRPASQFTGSRV